MVIPDGLVEDVLEVALGQCGALEVPDSTNLLGDSDSLFVLDGSHLLLAKPLTSGLVIAKIELCANENDRNAWRMMIDLREPLMEVS